jgi:hypothetical protein
VTAALFQNYSLSLYPGNVRLVLSNFEVVVHGGIRERRHEMPKSTRTEMKT